MKISEPILAITIIALAACAHIPQNKTCLMPPSEVTVAGDTIYCAGKPFAKLWSIDPKFNVEDKLFSSQAISGLGLAIHYYNNDKEVWIHPGKGLSVYQDGKKYTKIEDMQQAWSMIRHQAREYFNAGHGMYPQNKLPSIYIGNRHMEKEDYIRSCVFDVRISNDGKYIYYKAQGMLWNSSRKYLVEYGTSN